MRWMLIFLAVMAVVGIAEAARRTPRPQLTSTVARSPSPVPTPSPTSTPIPTGSPSPSPPGWGQTITGPVAEYAPSLGELLKDFVPILALLVAWRASGSSRALERPWLVVNVALPPVPVFDPTPSDPNATIAVVYEFENYGRSPCWVLEHHVGIKCVHLAATEKLPVPKPLLSPKRKAQPIRPGHASHGGSRNITLSLEEQQAMLKGEMGIMLHGVIYYRDVFGKVRKHGFAYVVWTIDEPAKWTGKFRNTWVSFDENDWYGEPGPEYYFKRST